MKRRSKSAMELYHYLINNARREDNGCLTCHLKPNKKGYSPVSLGGRQGQKHRAHRFIYECVHGELSEEKLVLHSCDNRRCIEITHLRAGTAAENTADMMSKGRNRNDPEASRKVRRGHVDVMRLMKERGFTLKQIGEALDISHETVRIYLKEMKHVQ